MEVRNKPKIEAIYPLNAMQQGLLFHHLVSQVDEGFLHVECTLTGELRIDILLNSWQATVERHAILRTSVHWKNMESPIQVVRPNKNMDLTYLDWCELSKEKQVRELGGLKQIQKSKGVDFEKGPLAEITLIKVDGATHWLLWSCHHLLLDGWSASTILKDLFYFYDRFCMSFEPVLDPIPSFKSYLNWLQNVDIGNASDYWKKTFSGFSKPSLFIDPASLAEERYQSNKIVISERLSHDLIAFAKKQHITINTLFQGIWCFLLSRYFGTGQIIFGATVSGRSASFPKIELMAGMFMNVLPVRTIIDPTSSVRSFLKEFQARQQEARNFEHCTNEQIASWIDLDSGQPLFDSLFVFENYPWQDITAGGVAVSDFHSGLTTTYPVTLVITTGAGFTMYLLMNSTRIDQATTDWFLDNLKRILDTLVSGTDSSIANVLDSLSRPKSNDNSIFENSKHRSPNRNDYVAPSNNLELELTNIWQAVFNYDPIGTKDNFFDLGGKSMLAIKLFAQIEKELGIKLSPTTLLEHPTIAGIAGIIKEKGSASPDWKYIVPIRSHGKKTPLFCIHAGGGHVFFYNKLANHVDSERPVYALQPTGLDGEGKMHQSIEEMALDYLEEIQAVQSKGTYHILVYCFSTALGLEMAIQLDGLGKKSNLIVVDTSAISYHYYNVIGLKTRGIEFVKRLLRNPIQAIDKLVKKRMNQRIMPNLNKVVGDSNQKNIERLRSNLMKLYYGYQWKQFNGNITLLVTPKKDRRFHQYVVDSWNKISTKGLNTIPLEGNHYNLFSEPDVKNTSKAIEVCIGKVETELE